MTDSILVWMRVPALSLCTQTWILTEERRSSVLAMSLITFDDKKEIYTNPYTYFAWTAN